MAMHYTFTLLLLEILTNQIISDQILFFLKFHFLFAITKWINE